MALTNGQKSALYLLLSSRSELRLMLEGKFTVNGGVVVPAENAPPQAAANPNVLTGRFLSLVRTRFGLAANQFNPSVLVSLHKTGATDPTGSVTNVTTSGPEIRTALEMTAPYPDNDPCPDLFTQNLVFHAIAGAVPSLSVFQLEKAQTDSADQEPAT